MEPSALEMELDAMDVINLKRQISSITYTHKVSSEVKEEKKEEFKEEKPAEGDEEKKDGEKKEELEPTSSLIAPMAKKKSDVSMIPTNDPE